MSANAPLYICLAISFTLLIGVTAYYSYRGHDDMDSISQGLFAFLLWPVIVLIFTIFGPIFGTSIAVVKLVQWAKRK